MNVLEREIKTQIVTLAMIAGKEVNEMMLAGYMSALSDLDPHAVLGELKNWMKTSRGFPYPSEIRERLRPEIDLRDEAEDVANLIIAAVGSCGYTNPGRAERMIGELGWEVVRRTGGWKHLCEVLNHDNETTYRAQLRNYAETVQKKSMRGDLHHLPELPESKQVKAIIENAMKRIGGE